MLDTLNRWFGRPQPEPAKAQVGSGWLSMMNLPHVNDISQNPANLMAEAQTLFRSNPWVAQAERAIYGRYISAAWHLEDSQGNTVEPNGPQQAVFDLLSPDEDDPNTLSREALWSLTLRHMGLCGNAFWYLDQRTLGGGAPLDIIYINPARMTPVESESNRLLGWVMDHPNNPVSQRRNLRSPVPFELDELRHFKLDEPDWGHFGIGVAEAAYHQIQLDELAVKHVAGVFAAGGRLAGLISPKPNVTMADEQWASLVRDWRNITADPDAAKRLLIAKGPVDFTSTAAKPSELEMAKLLELGRDDIFAAWGVPLSVGAGIVTSVGLNGGEREKYVEASLWQGPIEFRAKPFERKLQSVINTFGLGLKLVVEKPAFDDQAPLFENAEKASKQPLTNNERRALLGFDPLEDEEIGTAILIDQSMVPLKTESEPVPLPFQASQQTGEEENPEDSGLGEAAQAVKAKLREDVTGEYEPKILDAISEFLSKQATSIANRVRNNHRHIAAKPSDIRVWWAERDWNRELTALLEPLLSELAEGVSTAVARPLRAGKADTFLEKVIALVRRTAGVRITGINQTTRDAVARLIAAGVEQGLSPADLADTIRNAATFDAARAELIARTETGTAYNQAAVGTYRELDVKQVQVIDGDKDDICAPVNGATWSLDEAESNPLGHPNCVRDFIPLTA